MGRRQILPVPSQFNDSERASEIAARVQNLMHVTASLKPQLCGTAICGNSIHRTNQHINHSSFNAIASLSPLFTFVFVDFMMSTVSHVKTSMTVTNKLIRSERDTTVLPFNLSVSFVGVLPPGLPTSKIGCKNFAIMSETT